MDARLAHQDFYSPPTMHVSLLVLMDNSLQMEHANLAHPLVLLAHRIQLTALAVVHNNSCHQMHVFHNVQMATMEIALADHVNLASHLAHHALVDYLLNALLALLDTYFLPIPALAFQDVSLANI